MTVLPEVSIRYATKDDIDFIIDSQLNMALETENLSLQKTTVSAGVEGVFTNPHKGFYLVAVAGEKPIACLMITAEWSDWRNAWMWWIQSVYVLPEWRRNGVFGSMYDFLKARVNEQSMVSGMRLYVDKSNTTAQEVYRRMGMNGNHYLTFEWMK
ncbi:hypothetical protein DSECCO2_607380 [anaerobic digester metagenome]|nr:GNAT family N-acetyltransferase [Lentimicrobiaceae bacterium]